MSHLEFDENDSQLKDDLIQALLVRCKRKY